MGDVAVGAVMFRGSLAAILVATYIYIYNMYETLREEEEKENGGWLIGLES
jgi:hypothetical protein